MFLFFSNNYSVSNLKLRYFAAADTVGWNFLKCSERRCTNVEVYLSLQSYYLDIFVQVNRLIVYVVFQKIFIHTRKEGHFWQGKYIHELFHCTSLWALHGWGKKKKRNKRSGIFRIRTLFIQLSCRYSAFAITVHTASESFLNWQIFNKITLKKALALV